MSARTCAAITLDASGGGVAGVARLVWEAFQDRWADEARLVTLQPVAAATSRSGPDLSARLSFGSKLAMTQALGGSAWVFYTHVALAGVQRYIPAALQAPYAVFLHGIEMWRQLSRAQRSALEGARLLVANSAYTAQRAAEMHPWLGPIAVCNLALAHADADPAGRGEPAGRRDGTTVLVVGRMVAAERYKGHDQLIDAWPAVLRTRPHARLVVAGDGDDRKRLQAKAYALVGDGPIQFTGFVSDDELDTLYRGADVFAMPSRNEGFGLVYLEAMRHGLPCIGSRQDAAREVIDDGVTGLLVDQDDIASLTSVVTRLLGDDNARRSMGLAGRQRLIERFSRAQFRRRLMTLIDEAFGGAETGEEARAAGRTGGRVAAG